MMKESRPQSRVFVKNADYRNPLAVIREGMDQFPLDYTNKTVLIKPNLLGPHEPSEGITTHPAIVRAVLEYVKTKNPKQVYVGDSPGMSGYGQSRKVMEQTGMADVAGDALVFFSHSPKRIAVKSSYFHELTVPALMDEVDLIINVPKFKTHMLTYITGAIKNMFGIVVGADKARIHGLCSSVTSFSGALVDIYSLYIPAIHIMDAVVGMEANGPNAGRLLDIGKILISDNGVALDTVMALMMNINPSRIPLLSIAAERGLGPIDRERIMVTEKLPAFPRFKMPLTFHLENNPLLKFGLKLTGTFMGKRAKNRLCLDKALCIQCGACMKQCPVKAIRMNPFPVIDNTTCISCYCCYELCEYKAWKL